jgi:putative transposase
MDRDANAVWNILSRSLSELEVGHSKGTPVETAFPVDTPGSAKRVVETGGPCLKMPPKAASRQRYFIPTLYTIRETEAVPFVTDRFGYR